MLSDFTLDERSGFLHKNAISHLTFKKRQYKMRILRKKKQTDL